MTIKDRPAHMSQLDWLVYTFGNIEGVSSNLADLNSIPTIELLQQIKSELDDAMANLSQVSVLEQIKELGQQIDLKLEDIKNKLEEETNRAIESENSLEQKILDEQSRSEDKESELQSNINSLEKKLLDYNTLLEDRIKILEDKAKHLEWITNN